jgi:hypothetical protein
LGAASVSSLYSLHSAAAGHNRRRAVALQQGTAPGRLLKTRYAHTITGLAMDSSPCSFRASAVNADRYGCGTQCCWHSLLEHGTSNCRVPPVVISHPGVVARGLQAQAITAPGMTSIPNKHDKHGQQCMETTPGQRPAMRPCCCRSGHGRCCGSSAVAEGPACHCQHIAAWLHL